MAKRRNESDPSDHNVTGYGGRYRQRGNRDETKNEYGHMRIYLKIPKRFPSQPQGENSYRARRKVQRGQLKAS